MTAVAQPRVLTGRVLSWALWDWGSSAFNAVATTFVFTVYLTGDGRFAPGQVANERLSLGMTIAGVVVALLAPVTGQRADRRGRGRVWLGWFTALVVACLALMALVAPSSPLGREGALWLGIGLLGVGTVFFEFASVAYNAMLPRISTRETMGRVSGLGWGMGYVGGIVLLLILFVGFINPQVGLFGVTHEDGANVRASMLVAALWFALFAVPVLVRAPEPAAPARPGRESILASYRALGRTIGELWREARHTLWFLIASAVFRDGLTGVFTFGAVLASSVFGFSSSQVIVFAIVANVVAGAGTIALGRLDDRVGPKRVILFSLSVMLAAGLGVFALHGRGQIVFWTLGLALSVFVGPAQSASRSLLGRMIPAGREGEIFGLYATTGRAVSFLSPPALRRGDPRGRGGSRTRRRRHLLGHPRDPAGARRGPGAHGARAGRAGAHRLSGGAPQRASSRQTARASAPSPRPANPRPSVVLAATLTGASRMSERRRSISVRRASTRGRCATIVTTAFTTLQPPADTMRAHSCRKARPDASRHSGRWVPKFAPMSPRRAAESSASHSAWAAASPSEWPTRRGSPGHARQPSMSGRAGSGRRQKACASAPCPMRIPSLTRPG